MLCYFIRGFYIFSRGRRKGKDPCILAIWNWWSRIYRFSNLPFIASFFLGVRGGSITNWAFGVAVQKKKKAKNESGEGGVMVPRKDKHQGSALLDPLFVSWPWKRTFESGGTWLRVQRMMTSPWSDLCPGMVTSVLLSPVLQLLHFYTWGNWGRERGYRTAESDPPRRQQSWN